jgi:hypothetical protein
VTSVIVYLMKMKGCGRKRSLRDFNNCILMKMNRKGFGRKRLLRDFSNCTFNKNE